MKRSLERTGLRLALTNNLKHQMCCIYFSCHISGFEQRSDIRESPLEQYELQDFLATLPVHIIRQVLYHIRHN